MQREQINLQCRSNVTQAMFVTETFRDIRILFFFQGPYENHFGG